MKEQELKKQFQLWEQKRQARVTGSGDIEMHSSSKVNANITGSGDIVCYGNPQIQQIKTTGSGDVRVAN